MGIFCRLPIKNLLCEFVFHQFDANVFAGCYPQCPQSKPFFDEDNMKCVPWKECGCYDDKGNHYNIGDKIESKNCYDWYVKLCMVFLVTEQCKYGANGCMSNKK